LDVSIDDIEYLRGLRFTWTKITEVLRISRSTLYRRLDQEGIDRDLHYTDISDYDLDRVVESIKQSHPNAGERLLIGHLHRLRVWVPQARARGAIHRVDPIKHCHKKRYNTKACVPCSGAKLTLAY